MFDKWQQATEKHVGMCSYAAARKNSVEHSRLYMGSSQAHIILKQENYSQSRFSYKSGLMQDGKQ